jgi:hypothetical protein
VELLCEARTAQQNQDALVISAAIGKRCKFIARCTGAVCVLNPAAACLGLHRILAVLAVLPACRFASEVVITGGAFAYATMMYGKVGPLANEQSAPRLVVDACLLQLCCLCLQLQQRCRGQFEQQF